MKTFLEFFRGRNGQLSSKRLFMFMIVLLFSIDWFHWIFWGMGAFKPDNAVLTFIGAMFGVSVVGSLTEHKKESGPTQ